VTALNAPAATADIVSDISNPVYFPDLPSVLSVGRLPPSSELEFTVIVTNFLGGVATASRNVTVDAEAVPLVTIKGGLERTVSLPTSGFLTLAAEGSITLCDGLTSQGLNYSWTLVGSPDRDPVTTEPAFVVPLPSLVVGRKWCSPRRIGIHSRFIHPSIHSSLIPPFIQYFPLHTPLARTLCFPLRDL